MDSSENYKILKSFSGMAAPKAAPVTNTRKPVQKSTGFNYMPMSTDQAIELYRRQRYN